MAQIQIINAEEIMAAKLHLAVAVIVGVFALTLFYSSGVDAIGSDSCVGRCGISGTDNNFDCQCNTPCVKYEDCCEDYKKLCLGSCIGKCGDPYNSETCQCNTACVSYGDCCDDYNTECNGGVSNPDPISDEELINLSESLYSAEYYGCNVNNLVSDNKQGLTSQSSTDDVASEPLLTVDPKAFQCKTISLLTDLNDNYIADVTYDEDVTNQEIVEEDYFIEALLATQVFQQMRQFLIAKKYLTEENFRKEFRRIWFGQYSRATGSLGSSGFEHVFLGELKNGVSGFHNWVYFYNEEANGNMNYHGYLDYQSFGDNRSLIAHNFAWMGRQKPISSMFIGTNPELELCVYTICWYARPNGKCTMQFNGIKFSVQTYDITYNNEKYVASSYADISN